MRRVQLTLTAQSELPNVYFTQLMYGALSAAMTHLGVELYSISVTGMEDDGYNN